MKLHRILLENFRGIEYAEVDFPDIGVKVLHGPNESGKSSFIEAFDILTDLKASSGAKRVTETKPIGKDVGVIIEAELTLGEDRVVYRKEFVRGKRALLTFVDSTRLPLSGDDAHDIFSSLFAKTVDGDLWRALRLLQNQPSTQRGVTSEVTSLQRALDRAAGGTEEVGDGGLFEKVLSERRRYFTDSKAKATGELAAVREQLATRLSEFETADARYREVDSLVEQHRQNQQRLEAKRATLRATLRRIAESEEAVAEAGDLRAHAQRLRTEYDTAHHDYLRAQKAHRDREIALHEVEKTQERATALSMDIARLTVELDSVHAHLEQARSAEKTAVEAEQQARRLAASSRRSRELAVARREIDQIRIVLERIGDIDSNRHDLRAQLLKIAAEDDLDRADSAVERLRELRSMASVGAPTLEISTTAPLTVTVTGVETVIDTSWSTSVVTETMVRTADGTCLSIAPANAARAYEELTAAQEELTELLDAAGVEDAEGLVATRRKRARLISDLSGVDNRRESLLAGSSVDELRERLEELLSEVEADSENQNNGGADSIPDLASSSAIEQQWVEAEDKLRSARETAVAAAAMYSAAAKDLAVLEGQHCESSAHLAAAATMLDREREERSDLSLASSLDTAKLSAEELAKKYNSADELAQLSEQRAQTELVANDRAAAERLEREVTEIDALVRDAYAQICVLGAQGRKHELDEAETTLYWARDHAQRIERRAAAVDLLFSTLEQSRDAATARYREPFRQQIRALGKLVFDDRFDVELGDDLEIVSRVDRRGTVPFQSLSTGAKEQLAIISRLACAQLVDPIDGVPVFLDDALGYTDPDRRAKMGAVLDEAGRFGQVIVLTCDDERYATIGHAQTQRIGNSDIQRIAETSNVAQAVIESVL